MTYYYLNKQQAMNNIVLMLKKSATRIPNMDAEFGSGMAVEFIADKLPTYITWDTTTQSVRAATSAEIGEREKEYLYAGVGIFGDVWHTNNFNPNDYVLRSGDSVFGTLQFTGVEPIILPFGKGIRAFNSTGKKIHGFYLNANNEIILSDGANAVISGGQLKVGGKLVATNDVISFSDRRVKSDIKSVKNALDKINCIEVATFRYTENDDNRRHLGVIAQSVENVVPEVVHTDENGMLQVAYPNMVALALAGIQEMQKEISDLKRQINKAKRYQYGKKRRKGVKSSSNRSKSK